MWSSNCACTRRHARQPSDDEDEHNAWNLFLKVVGAVSFGHAGGKESFFEDEKLARTALSCHLPMHLLRQEMSDAWWFEDHWKVGHDAMK